MKKYIKLIIPLCGLILLLIPLFHMNTSEITEQENRTLAKFPEAKKKDKPNYEFGKEFESWLGDRFWGRDQLIDARFQTMYKINGRIENDKAFVGDDGWMFMKDGIVNVPSLEKQRERIEKDADILKRFDDKFKGKNIPIYLVLIPDRNQLYQKYWERYYTPKPKLDYGDELTKALQDHPNIHVIYPKEEFIEAMETEDLFYKDDVHMTDIPRKILIKNVFDTLKRDYFPKNDLELILTKNKKNFNHVANISAKLGMIGRSDVTLTSIQLRLSQKIKTKTLDSKKWEIIGNNGYKGGYLNPWVVSETEDAIISKTGIFYGPCYVENIYANLRGLFKKYIKIRPNVSEAGAEAVQFMQEKTDKLIELKEDSVIILMPTNLDLINESLSKKTIEI